MAGRALPDFPWDRLTPYAEIARSHSGGIVDLSVGTPVDPTPVVVRDALIAAADSPGYPLTAGTPGLREAAAGWFARMGIPIEPSAILPTIGSKELVAWLPTLLDLGPESTVVIPTLAYPTYDVGARIAGAKVVAADDLTSVKRADLIWINTPANPHGRVMPVAEMREAVRVARDLGAVLASDECYLELGWDAKPVSVLHPDVTDGDHTNVLSVHSLSKRSNLAGYRSGLIAGDQSRIASLLEIRKHAGMMLPGPVQAASVAAFDDDLHVTEQRARYARRREVLLQAVTAAGLRVEHSEAGLYIWATRDESCWDTVAAFAAVGVLVTPGEFYGEAGARHVRIALTATDERIDAAVSRLTLLAIG